MKHPVRTLLYELFVEPALQAVQHLIQGTGAPRLEPSPVISRGEHGVAPDTGSGRLYPSPGSQRSKE